MSRCAILVVLLQGFGLEGLGIVTVSGVPSYPELRQQLLPLAQAFAVRNSSSCWFLGFHAVQPRSSQLSAVLQSHPCT